jgi:hypothetical protein
MQLVGGPIVTLPSTVLETMRHVNTDVLTVDAEIVGNAARLSDQFKIAWQIFRAEWLAFYNANQSEMAMLVVGTGTVMRQTLDYSDRVSRWRAQLAAQAGVQLVSPPLAPLKDPNASGIGTGLGDAAHRASEDYTRILNSIALVAGVLLVGYVAVVYVPKFLPAVKGAK